MRSFSSRRRPRLRVVGGEAPHTLAFRIGTLAYAGRAWTDAEWEALAGRERPPHAVRMAGLGWVVIGPEFGDANAEGGER